MYETTKTEIAARVRGGPAPVMPAQIGSANATERQRPAPPNVMVWGRPSRLRNFTQWRDSRGELIAAHDLTHMTVHYFS